MPYHEDMCLQCMCVSVRLENNFDASTYYRSSHSRPKEKRALCMPTPFYEAEYRNEGFMILGQSLCCCCYITI